MKRLYGGAAILLALAIFALDVLSPLQGAVAVLYTVVVLLSSKGRNPRLILACGSISVIFALLGYAISHWDETLDAAAMRLGVSLVAITITTLLCLRGQKAAEDRRRSDQRYRAIFNSAGLPIWESDWRAVKAIATGVEQGAPPVEQAVELAIIRDANDAAARLFGMAMREELLGANLAKHHTPAAEASFARIVRALANGKDEIEEETQFLNIEGEVVDVVLRVTLPPDCEDWGRVLIMALDMTERNRAQSRLAQAQTDLAHVSRLTTLGQLAASIAHEVNQPLSAVVTYARSGKRWLAREAPDAAETADCLEQIAANGTRAADVIARIRDLARKGDPDRAPVKLAPLIEESIALLRRDLHSHGVAIRVAIDADLPDVMGDRGQLQQVLMNLMLNADQAMAGSAVAERALDVTAVREGDMINVSVRDAGRGLPGDPEALFVPFYTTRAEGLGMGLSICRAILEQHGGTLAAANNPDAGAIFWFGLPAARGNT
ncbi:MAG TPA: ATP-binding protein [Sphingomonadaceae bacterium]|nr:ATP-binding protein [Sphingomonadaceae bacterium]